MNALTPETVRAREDRARLFPPICPVRLIFLMFWPMTGLSVIAFAGFILPENDPDGLFTNPVFCQT